MSNKTENTKLKAYKVSISGTYRAADKEYIDYDNVVGYIPFAEYELAEAMVRKRYALMWITLDKRYTKRVQTVREVYIDALEETEADFTFPGKNILELTYAELQDLATAKELRAVPLYKKGGLRQAQTVAYAEYSNKVLGVEVDYKEAGFNVAKEPPIVVDGGAERNIAKTLSNEEVIDLEQKSSNAKDGVKKTITRDELEKMARERDIAFNGAITDKALYKKIFNS